MKTQRRNTSAPSATRSPLLAAGAILIGLAGLWFFGHATIQKGRAALVAEHAQSLDDLGKLTQQLFLAEEEKLDSLLIRVRSDLRADGKWAEQGAASQIRDAAPLTPEAEREKEVAVQLGEGVTDDRWRRVRADLKRGLSARPDLHSLELVVADQAGLTAVRVARTAKGLAEDFDDPRTDKGVAKAIWYADEVRRAVAANGRRLVRGPHTRAGVGDSETLTMRVALGLHDPSELVQGVLVATLDLAPVADSLAALAGSGIQARILSLDGRPLNSSAFLALLARPESADGTPIGPEREASLAARIADQKTQPDAFEADQYLVNGFPLVHGDESASESILLMETRLPPNDLIAQASTAWGLTLVGATFISLLTIVFLVWRSRTAPAELPGISEAPLDSSTAPSEAEVPNQDESLSTTSSPEPVSAVAIAREQIVLREWLGDVRGCLERDAATRGLSLNLQCERSLPISIEQDPGWLGGLLIAMGQEALDATSEDRVFVRVREDAHEVLRFEVDAGPIELSPVEGMHAVAGELGGHFESSPEGGLAFLMPLAAN